MKLSQKMTSVVGALIVSFGITAGALAQGDSHSSMDLSLNVTCLEAADVSLSGNGNFAPVDTALNDSTSTGVNALKVKVNVGCYWEGWRVDAEITRFENEDGDWIAGSNFSLEAGPVSSFFSGPPPFPFEPIPPHAHDTEFSGVPGPPIGDADGDNPIFHTSNLLEIINLDPSFLEQPAPYYSEAYFTGHLDNLMGADEGQYVATLTTILVLEN